VNRPRCLTPTPARAGIASLDNVKRPCDVVGMDESSELESLLKAVDGAIDAGLGVDVPPILYLHHGVRMMAALLIRDKAAPDKLRRDAAAILGRREGVDERARTAKHVRRAAMRRRRPLTKADIVDMLAYIRNQRELAPELRAADADVFCAKP
jgi:hypothetical protein